MDPQPVIVYDRVWLTLRKNRRRTEVLEDCTVTLPSDKRVGILAHRGTGKSTVIQLAAGSMEPNRGRITRGVVPSYPVGTSRLFNNTLTLRENVVFGCRLYGFDPRPIITFVDERLALGPHLDRPLGVLPREFRNPTMFMISYAMPFDLYCVDDNPTAGTPEVREMLEAMLRQRTESSGLIMTHAVPKILARYCDVFYILKDRRIIPVPDLETGVQLLGPPPKRFAPVVDEEGRDTEEEDDEFMF